MAILTTTWQLQTHDIALIEKTISPIPPGSRVMITVVLPEDAEGHWDASPAVRKIGGVLPANYHLATYFLMERRAFFQTLFTDPSQQPVSVRQPYLESAQLSAAWGPPSYSMLVPGFHTQKEQEPYPYLVNWQSKFDYVLIMNAGGMRDWNDFLRDRLCLVETNELAVLFRVRPSAGLPR